MVEIRRIKAEEMIGCKKIWTVVYNGRESFDTQKEKEDDKEEDADAENLKNPVEWMWGYFDNGRLMSCIAETPYLMRFDGHSVSMTGIGGVGTLPEARSAGCVRQIFEKILPEEFEKGVVFSNLTPFSHPFYRKFGYELCCARNEVSIPTVDFASLKPTGTFVPVFPKDDTSALSAVHTAYIADINHGICRDYWENNRAWRQFTENDPYSTGIFLYLWYNDEGIPKAYIKYQDEDTGEDHTMLVKELAFVDREGLYGALGLVRGLSSQYKTFKWPMPTFIDPADFIPDMWAVEQNILPRDMTRIINVKAALELMRRPGGEGAYTVAVTDEHIEANNKTFLVEYGAGKSRVSITDKDADMRCTVTALSQLVTGYRTLENALLSKKTGLEVLGNRETLNKVWTLRPQHITEYF